MLKFHLCPGTEAPISRLEGAYKKFRRDKDSQFAFKWMLAIVGGIVAINLWIAFTDQGGAVWAWLAN